MQTIVFDMYGVILKDPNGSLMPFINYSFPELKEDDIYPYWEKAGAGEITSLDFWKMIGYKDELCKVEETYLDTIVINEEFYDVVTILCENYRIALLSNDISEWSLYLREKYKLNQYFDAIVISGDVKLRKPDPAIFEFLLRELGQPASECIFLDDRRKNLSTAKEMGMDAILFNSRRVEYEGKIVNNFIELLNLVMPQYVRNFTSSKKGCINCDNSCFFRCR